MENIISPIKEELDIFEKKLRKIIAIDENFLTNDLEEFIFSNPKRLRPILIFLFAKILDIKDELVFDIALASEIMHSASLIHDDIIDEEEKRRDVLTFYEKHGSKTAVLQGDFLLSLGLGVLSNTSLDIVKIFSEKIYKTILGEICQNGCLNKILDVDKYYHKTFAKTANLFFAGLESLYTLKNVELAQKSLLFDFLQAFTIAFQVKNDIDDFKGKKSDFEHGNYTLPMIYYTKEYGDSKFDIEKAQEAISLSEERIYDLRIRAIESIMQLDGSEYTKSLFRLCEYVLRG